MPTLLPILADQLTPTLASLRAADPADAVVLMAEVAAERPGDRSSWPGDRSSWLSILASISARSSRSSRKTSSCGGAEGAEMGAPLTTVLSASVVLSASHSWSRAPSELSSSSRF